MTGEGYMRRASNGLRLCQRPAAVRQIIATLAICQWAFCGYAAEEPIKVELSIPAAETHVIGDPIPLVWRFSNQSTDSLAFMWEGCCRLNGRLKVTSNGEGLIPIPPGASTAHQFARAIKVAPGTTREFPTMLHDWITLKETGDYQLDGHYRGVLPEQRPQVPRGVELWRDEAAAPSLRLAVISTEDYLKQRGTRATQRKLALDLKGPASVSPLKTNVLSLRISNSSSAPQKLNWPGAFQLWILNAAGNRLPANGVTSETSGEELVIGPGATLTREIPFHATVFEGEPFGEYDVFIDLAAASNEVPRVPSNDISVHWRLGNRQVAELVSAAAQGPKTGLRNAPLKWLRTYLAEIRGALDDLTPATPAEAALTKELVLAARLKPFSSNPGPVNIGISVGASGAWRFADDGLVSAYGKATGVEFLASTLAVRRHLGWDVAAAIKPDDDARLEQILEAVKDLVTVQADLAAPLRALVPVANSTVAASLTFQTNHVPANFIVRLSRAGGTVRVEAARRLPDPQQPQLSALIQPTEIWSAPFNSLPDAPALESLLADGQLKSPQILIMASPALTWRELLDAIEPVLKRGVAVDLSLTKQ